MTVDTDVFHAQWVPDHQWTIEVVLMLTVTETKSTEMICSAHNVNGAQQELFQIQQEDIALLSQDHQSK